MGSWADALTSGEVSPQANKASPASLMFMAATQSALAENPHSRQVNCACLLRLSPEVCPHSRHWRLVFIGGTRDERFHAFDKSTGKLLWETQLPTGGYATPSTYSVNGKQYAVIAAGGGGKLRTRSGDSCVAFGLP